MSIPPGVVAARVSLAAMMIDAVAFATPERDVDGALDLETGKVVFAAGTAGYSGKCLAGARSERVELEGGRVAHRTRYLIRLPFDATPVPAFGDLATITAAGDHGLVGRLLRVDQEVAFGSLHSSRHVWCADATDDPGTGKVEQ